MTTIICSHVRILTDFTGCRPCRISHAYAVHQIMTAEKYIFALHIMILQEALQLSLLTSCLSPFFFYNETNDAIFLPHHLARTYTIVTVHSCLVNSNNSQAHLEFCFAKGACEHLNHVLTHQNSKCFGAVCTVTK